MPGHEIAGRVDALGDGVTEWQVGQRVGVGWHGGHCGVCVNCRRGDFITCVKGQVPGIAYDGGYADYMIAPHEALAAIPDDLDALEAAPLLCAGITTYNSLRHSGAKAGDVVAILGIGGLGHLGVQFAAKMGFHTIAIARGPEKKALALKLGAHRYIDSKAEDAAKALTELGGAKVILATVTSAKAMTPLIDGPWRRRQAARGRRLARAHRGDAASAHRQAALGCRLALGESRGLRRHHALQRAHRRQTDDRDLPSRQGA